jgi:hypothetical protein
MRANEMNNGWKMTIEVGKQLKVRMLCQFNQFGRPCQRLWISPSDG